MGNAEHMGTHPIFESDFDCLTDQTQTDQMAIQKVSELKGKSKDELTKQLNEYKQELNNLRVAKVSGSGAPSKLGRIRDVRKSISRTLTVINTTQKSAVRQLYKGKKNTPIDLRPKKTRAIRRQLNPTQLAAKTPRALNREMLFAQRKYALKA